MRVGFDIYVPTMGGVNAMYHQIGMRRELRYGKDMLRVLRSSVDVIRGHALSLRSILRKRSKVALLSYPIATILRLYRHHSLDNAM